jgi:hypothetical protein
MHVEQLIMVKTSQVKIILDYTFVAAEHLNTSFETGKETVC